MKDQMTKIAETVSTNLLASLLSEEPLPKRCIDDLEDCVSLPAATVDRWFDLVRKGRVEVDEEFSDAAFCIWGLGLITLLDGKTEYLVGPRKGDKKMLFDILRYITKSMSCLLKAAYVAGYVAGSKNRNSSTNN